MQCLNCKKTMTNYVIHTPLHQLSYDICDSCGSLWLDKGEFNKIVDEGSGDVEYCSQDVVTHDTKICPRCDDEALDKVKFIGDDRIILDHCKNCGGFWLDGGQLTKIEEFEKKIGEYVQRKGFSEFIHDTHLPYYVKRIRHSSDEVDSKIPVMPIKGAKIKAQTQDICPVCHTNLDLYSDFHIDFEGCPKCRGMWLEKGKIKELKSKVDDGNVRWMDDELEAIEKIKAMLLNRDCPKCKGKKLMGTKFGNSNLVIDWCPSCHGVWLDRDEFLSIVNYLENEQDHLKSGEVAKIAEKEVEKVWTGHGNKLTEVVDAEKAIGALINISIYEHPKLAMFLLNAGQAAYRTTGI